MCIFVLASMSTSAATFRRLSRGHWPDNGWTAAAFSHVYFLRAVLAPHSSCSCVACALPFCVVGRSFLSVSFDAGHTFRFDSMQVQRSMCSRFCVFCGFATQRRSFMETSTCGVCVLCRRLRCAIMCALLQLDAFCCLVVHLGFAVVFKPK